MKQIVGDITLLYTTNDFLDFTVSSQVSYSES